MDSRILVVDDEPITLKVLSAWLSVAELESAGAHDRPTATAMLQEQAYPVVVADLCLENFEEGLRLIDEIRRIRPSSRIITYTGYASPEMEAEALERGSTRVVCKSAGHKAVVEAIREALEEIERAADAVDEVELETLYLQTATALKSTAQRRYGLSAQQAEDVVHDAWLLFLNKRGYVRTPRSWLAGTVSNLCLQRLNEVRRRKTDVDADLLAAVADPKSMHGIDLHLTVSQAMSRLDDRSRELCVRIGLEGRRYDEVSEALGLPIGSVGPLYMRAKGKLRKALG